ncbi:hypothetical protein [Clostridium lacusfryxellense]|uniref:hypothetical protein n=1 Tax=Clostridium lacusfryxellense TaxID=205328 RepID=UPI001C0E45D9|nr:hypothetical protein [Clostridium lacusfryxellense]MBU3110832.1 hypothetical protein [Clostridium lacusfryxellense]
MSINVNCDTKFHNVGQGIFYSGHIFNEDFNFYFIYDCGTESTQKYIRRSIEELCYEIKRNKSKLNLLVISHFDNDHVNQLGKLLDSIEVDTVIMPYLTPICILALAAKFSRESEEYYDFIADPIKYLIGKKVNNIILLGEGDASEDEVIFSNLDNLDNLDDNLIIKLENDNELKEFVMENEDINDISKVMFRKHDGYIFLKNLWMFRFFNCSSGEEDLYRFITMLDSYKIDISTTSKIVEIIIDKDKRNILKHCYKTVWKSINNTSVVMYHSPIGKNLIVDNYITVNHKRICTIDKKYQKQSKRHCRELHYAFNRFSTIYQKNISGTLLFGDIDLNYRYKEITTHFKNGLDNILIIQVPHHGSVYNMCYSILEDVNNGSTWVVPFGIYNRHNHPNEVVIEIIRELSPAKMVVPNNECYEIVIDSNVTYE